MSVDYQSIAPPFPLKNAEFIDGRPAYPGTPFIIGFIDQRVEPVAPHIARRAQAHPSKPWMAIVHQLPERANRWRKYYVTLEEATADALMLGLLTSDCAEEIALNRRCVPGAMLVFAGITPHLEASIVSFEPEHGAAVDSWETLQPILNTAPVIALAPATERVC